MGKLKYIFFKLNGHIKKIFLSIAFRFPIFSALYFCYDSSFNREHRAVISAQFRHKKNINKRNITEITFILRRNIHRLEKGIITKPRRNIFALDYIKETIDAYVSVSSNHGDNENLANNSLLKWATDVLDLYFRITDNHPIILKCEECYKSSKGTPNSESKKHVPYKRNMDIDMPSFDTFKQLTHQRRSVRWFLPKEVPRHLINNAMEVALQSPSACNRQPFEFRIYDDPKLVQEIGSIPMGTRGFVQNFPSIAVIIGKLQAFPFARDRHVIYIDASLAAMTFQFGLETQKISSCCINWPDIPEKEYEMSNKLNLQTDERVIMLLAIGYPDPEGLVPFSQKLKIEEALSYNKL